MASHSFNSTSGIPTVLYFLAIKSLGFEFTKDGKNIGYRTNFMLRKSVKLGGKSVQLLLLLVIARATITAGVAAFYLLKAGYITIIVTKPALGAYIQESLNFHKHIVFFGIWLFPT